MGLGQESSPGCSLEDLTNTLVGSCGAFEILVGSNLLANFLTLFRSNWLLRGLVQLLNGLGVMTKILLATDENDGEALAEVKNLGDPLLLDVVKGIGGIDGEADQDDVGVGV